MSLLLLFNQGAVVVSSSPYASGVGNVRRLFVKGGETELPHPGKKRRKLKKKVLRLKSSDLRALKRFAQTRLGPVVTEPKEVKLREPEVIAAPATTDRLKDIFAITQSDAELQRFAAFIEEVQRLERQYQAELDEARRTLIVAARLKEQDAIIEEAIRLKKEIDDDDEDVHAILVLAMMHEDF